LQQYYTFIIHQEDHYKIALKRDHTNVATISWTATYTNLAYLKFIQL